VSLRCEPLDLSYQSARLVTSLLSNYYMPFDTSIETMVWKAFMDCDKVRDDNLAFFECQTLGFSMSPNIAPATLPGEKKPEEHRARVSIRPAIMIGQSVPVP
jgi:hypothetical protein